MISSLLTLVIAIASADIFSDMVVIGGDAKKPSIYATDYYSARDMFRFMGKELETAALGTTGSIPISSTTEKDLTIDTIYLPYKKSPKLFILTSGIHGIEAKTGSAIQVTFLKRIKENRDQFPFNILVIHSLNPYGFKKLRRTNENNVDLNRNFLSPQEFQTANKSYRRARHLFNPPGPANTSWISCGQFYLSAIWTYIYRGKKAILHGLSGQYHDPTGPYFGGTSLQPETKNIQHLIAKHTTWIDAIYLVDIHTGYGEAGKLHFFGSEEKRDKRQTAAFEAIFSDIHVDNGNMDDFYPTTGDFADWLTKAYAQKTVIPMVFEFGTMNSQTITGGLRSLWIMTIENQGFHNDFVSPQDKEISRNNFISLFDPLDQKWQAAVLEQADKSLSLTLRRFAEH